MPTPLADKTNSPADKPGTPAYYGSTGAALSAGRMALILTHVRASLPFPNGLESEGVQ